MLLICCFVRHDYFGGSLAAATVITAILMFKANLQLFNGQSNGNLICKHILSTDYNKLETKTAAHSALQRDIIQHLM